MRQVSGPQASVPRTPYLGLVNMAVTGPRLLHSSYSPASLCPGLSLDPQHPGAAGRADPVLHDSRRAALSRHCDGDSACSSPHPDQPRVLGGGPCPSPPRPLGPFREF